MNDMNTNARFFEWSAGREKDHGLFNKTLFNGEDGGEFFHDRLQVWSRK
jgi:hypothetical protein